MSVINNNNVLIYERFHMSWYTKQSQFIQWTAMMFTYMDKVEPIKNVELHEIKFIVVDRLVSE